MTREMRDSQYLCCGCRRRRLLCPDSGSDGSQIAWVSLISAGRGWPELTSCLLSRVRPRQAAEQTLQIRGWRRLLRLQARLVLGLKTRRTSPAITGTGRTFTSLYQAESLPSLQGTTKVSEHWDCVRQRYFNRFMNMCNQSLVVRTMTETFYRHLQFTPATTFHIF